MHNRPQVGPDDPTWPGYATPQPQQQPGQPASPPAQYVHPMPPAPPTYQQPPRGARYPMRQSYAFVSRGLYGVAQLVSLALVIVEGLLIVRIALLLLAANPDAGFSSWIYGLTTPLVAPFQGVFPSIGGDGQGIVLDTAAILAMVVYAILARVVEAIMRLFARL